MLLPFTSGLATTWRCDPEMAQLADRHYSRQTIGSREFVGNGEPLILRDGEGLVVFAWLRCLDRYRNDGQFGYYCSIFRNESLRRSSEIIIEAEGFALRKWGSGRAFTYINPSKIQSANPGYCFKCAGWQLVRDADGRPQQSTRGNLILEKHLGAIG